MSHNFSSDHIIFHNIVLLSAVFYVLYILFKIIYVDIIFYIYIYYIDKYITTFLVAQTVKNLPAVWETSVRSLGWEDPLEKGVATHCSILAWRIPSTEKPGRLQSMGSQKSQTGLSD